MTPIGVISFETETQENGQSNPQQQQKVDECRS